MERINLFLLNLSHKNTINGVDRYVAMLFDLLKDHPHFRVHWIHFVCDDTLLWHRRKQYGEAVKVTIPWPQKQDQILMGKFRMHKYNQQALRIIEPLLTNKTNALLHVHVLNLIDFALEIRRHVPCKIITHVHCSPWKDLYNIDANRFNQLYDIYDQFEQGRKPIQNEDIFVTHHAEKSAYFDADHIICLTRCARDFLTQIMKVSSGKITLIPNGIHDACPAVTMDRQLPDRPFRFIYVGVLSKSKGLHWILQALDVLRQRGYDVALTIAGSYHSEDYASITKKYGHLNLTVSGPVAYEQLKQYYAQSDAGVIASVKDQSSLAALEMAMFGLPIVVTAIEGLDETFTDQVNALKVKAVYSKLTGLHTDVGHLAEQMARVIDDADLRRNLARNARKLYEDEHTISLMLQRTIHIFRQTLKLPVL